MELLVKALLVCHHHYRAEEEGDLFWKVAVMAAETLPVESVEGLPNYATYGEDFLKRLSRLSLTVNQPTSSFTEEETTPAYSDPSQNQTNQDQNQTNTIPFLFPELIYHIAECFAYPSRDHIVEAQKTLATVSRVCKFWNRVFSPILYRCPKFKNAMEMDRFLAVTLKFALPNGKSPLPVQQIALYCGEEDLWLGDYLLQYGNESQQEFPFPNILFLHLAKTYPRLKRVFFVKENGTKIELKIMKRISKWVQQVEKLHSSVEGIFDTFDKMRHLVPDNAYSGFSDSALKTCLPLLDILFAESEFINKHCQKLIVSDAERFKALNPASSSTLLLLPACYRRSCAMQKIRYIVPLNYSTLPLPSPNSSPHVWDFFTENDKRTVMYKIYYLRQNRA